MRAFAVTTAAALTCCAANTRAAERPREHWYGWQTLTADAVSVATIVGALAIDDDPRDSPVGVIMLAGGIAFIVAGPTIHFAHHRPTTALQSLGVRALLPTAGALLFGSVAVGLAKDCGAANGEAREECEGDRTVAAILGGGLGGLGGMVAASWIDASWFAREPVTHETSWRLAPTIARDRVTLALAGRF